MVSTLLRLEGLIFFVVAVFFYSLQSDNWLLFFLLILAPDISMVGYLRNKRLGAILYNLVHNYVLGILVTAVGVYLNIQFVILLGIILFAHVAMDHMFGYGLKYPSGFKDTHLQKV